jgi:hypothetical protein
MSRRYCFLLRVRPDRMDESISRTGSEIVHRKPDTFEKKRVGGHLFPLH